MASIKFPSFGLHAPFKQFSAVSTVKSVVTSFEPTVPTSASSLSGVAGLQKVDVGFGLGDLSEMRIVLTSDARPRVVETVALEAQRLVKLAHERDNAPPGADTAQVESEIQKVLKGLSSHLAARKGVFLSKDSASVELGSSAIEAAPSRDPVAKALATAAAVGVDPVTGESVVLQPMGRVVENRSLRRFVAIHAERANRQVGAKVLAQDRVAVEALRSLSDDELASNGLRGANANTEYVTLNGENSEDKAMTYATRWFKKPNDLFARRMVVEGPFRGCYLDDVVSRLDEASLQASAADSRLRWLSPTASNRQPAITAFDVREGGEQKTKLRLRLPSTPEWTAVRQSMSELAKRLPDVRQVEDSKSTLFVFDPSSYTFIQKISGSFSKTQEAQRVVDAHIGELLKFEKALTPEALERYSAKNIGGFRSTSLDREGRVRPFELSPIQRSTLARLELDGWRGAVTLGTGMGKTLIAISALELMSKQGEKRPFLVVVPDGLQGGFAAEIFAKRTPEAAEALVNRLQVMTYTEFRRAVKKGESKGEPFDASRFGAVVYDEAHIANDRKTASGSAILRFRHPRTIEMTGTPQPEPERLQTMDAGVRAVDLNSPAGKTARNQARNWRKLLFDEVNGVTVGVKGAFELRRGLKIDPTREMLEWIRSRFIYAEGIDDNVALPKRTDVQLTLNMSPELEGAYRSVAEAGKVQVALEGLASIYRDRGLADPAATSSRAKLTPQARDASVREVRRSLKPVIQKLAVLTNNEEKLAQVGKALLQKMHEDEAAGLPAGRALLFTDDAGLRDVPGQKKLSFVELSAKVMSQRVPVKLHAACLDDKIAVYQNGQALKKLGPFKLPFRKGSYRPDPTMPENPTTNRAVPESEWRTFVLNEVLGKHPEVATTTLFGPTYQAGQNLQWANTVVHLDRDTWSDFNMRQREARSLRRGQNQPVTVMQVDYVFASPRSSLDLSLDQVRALQAKNDRALLRKTLVAAQNITLGDGVRPARTRSSFDVGAPLPPDTTDLGLFVAGAMPTAANVGQSRARS